ncbi:MAG: hypothetical protein LC659_05830, partial [Myxococcales bacterium]|nr:hypothetical protein [Myxococcales bacterium]
MLLVAMCAVGPARGAAWVALDTLLAAGSTLALVRLLPARLRSDGNAAVAGFVFATALLLPGVGALGLLIGLVAPLRWPRPPEPASRFRVVRPPELPFRPTRVAERPVYGEGHLVGMLRHGARPDQRLRAVMATRQLTDQYAIPVLGVALKDRVDDVRLLAYSLLDRKERALYT